MMTMAFPTVCSFAVIDLWWRQQIFDGKCYGGWIRNDYSVTFSQVDVGVDKRSGPVGFGSKNPNQDNPWMKKIDPILVNLISVKFGFGLTV